MKKNDAKIEELRKRVKLGLKIIERLEKSAVIPAEVLRRNLAEIRKGLDQARLNLLNSDILTKSPKLLTDTENFVSAAWLTLKMLIAWNNGTLFNRIDEELRRFSSCPFCGAEVQIGSDWLSGNTGYYVAGFPCKCLTGDNSFAPQQERFGLYGIYDQIALGGLFADVSSQPVVTLTAYYCRSLNEEKAAPFGWQIVVEIRPENFVPVDTQLVWQQMKNLPTAEEVRLAKLIDRICWVDFFDLRDRLVRGNLDDQEIAVLTERLLTWKKDLNEL